MKALMRIPAFLNLLALLAFASTSTAQPMPQAELYPPKSSPAMDPDYYQLQPVESYFGRDGDYHPDSLVYLSKQ